MAKKFDTNPLDPEFPEKARQTQKELRTTTLPKKEKARTRKFAEAPAPPAEPETRRFGQEEFDSYQAPAGNGGQFPAAAAPQSPQPLYAEGPEKDKKDRNLNIGSISLPENVLTALPYVPFGPVGIIAGLIELVFVPKSEPKVRYHAAQGLAAQLGVWLILTVLGSLEGLIGFDEITGLFWLVSTIILVVFAVKAWQGKPIHIESVEALTDWLEERITPQN